jgi:S1-C subfamily serine protease
MDADLVVIEQTQSGAQLSLQGTAYRRQLPYERATPQAKQPTFSHREPAKLATGTGFVVAADGAILTAYHVVDGARSVIVSLPTGDVMIASVSGKLPSADLALLRVKRSTPAYLSLADAKAVEVGQRVFTLGFPVTYLLGMEPKFSDGSVSALSESTGGHEVFQVTVPVQPGNSGGPLVTEEGQVVGVISSTAAVESFYRSTGSLPQGVNFAVKSDLAKGLFDPSAPQPRAASRHDAIERVTKALCFIEAISGDGLIVAREGFGKLLVPKASSSFDATRKKCERGDSEACLATALAIVDVCGSREAAECADARFAHTIVAHACAVGRTEACRSLSGGASGSDARN